MRFFTAAIGATATAGLLAACSGSNLGSTGSSLPSTGAPQAHGLKYAPVSVVPPWLHSAGIARLRLNDRIVPAKGTGGLIYASNFYQSSVWGYKNPNNANNPPTCTLSGLSSVNGFGTDYKGNTIIPAFAGGSHLSVNVYKPKCGALIWSASDANGQPADAYTNGNAATGSVLVGELANYTTGAGAIEICSSTGCGTPFSNAAVTGYGAGVAMAKNGDCWLSAEKSGFSGYLLVYFKGCSGSGQIATGTSNTYYGGLFIDTKGNLGSIDAAGTLWVYKGCNPACSLVSSTTLHGASLFGGLDKKGKNLAIGDYGSQEVDIYKYSPSGSTYSYTFNNGMTSGSHNDVEAAHFAPRNKKI
jgi:hypothetical protein